MVSWLTSKTRRQSTHLAIGGINRAASVVKKQLHGDGSHSSSELPDINVKKLQFIHMLMATDHRTSKTAKIKKLFYHTAAH